MGMNTILGRNVFVFILCLCCPVFQRVLSLMYRITELRKRLRASKRAYCCRYYYYYYYYYY
jgi:hypothetical protein